MKKVRKASRNERSIKKFARTNAGPVVRKILDEKTNLDKAQISDVVKQLSIHSPEILSAALNMPLDELANIKYVDPRIDMIGNFASFNGCSDAHVCQPNTGTCGIGYERCEIHGCDTNRCSALNCDTNNCGTQTCSFRCCGGGHQEIINILEEQNWQEFQDLLENVIRDRDFSEPLTFFINPVSKYYRY